MAGQNLLLCGLAKERLQDKRKIKSRFHLKEKNEEGRALEIRKRRDKAVGKHREMEDGFLKRRKAKLNTVPALWLGQGVSQQLAWIERLL